jgi:hypothetical protein
MYVIIYNILVKDCKNYTSIKGIWIEGIAAGHNSSNTKTLTFKELINLDASEFTN